MNTKAEIHQLTQQVCELMHITETEIVTVQVDLAQEYLLKLGRIGWLHDAEEARLLFMLPEFWAWWRQRWANHDRQLLASLTRLSVLELMGEGLDMVKLYAGTCAHLASLEHYPNDVISDDFEAEKRRYYHAYHTLTNLLTTP